MSTKLIITRCTDHLMWYRHLTGRVVPIVRDLPAEHCWLSREPSGLTNIVRYHDASPLPQGWDAAANDTSFQRGDMVFINGQWMQPALERIGTPIGKNIVIRKEST